MPNADGGLTETEWQQQVIDLAHLLGWRHLHVRRSVGRGRRWVTATNVEGWPDLLLWHPSKGGVIAAELKVGNSQPTADQVAVLDSLRAAGIPSYVWRPDDLPDVQATLDHRSLTPSPNPANVRKIRPTKGGPHRGRATRDPS